MSLKDRADDLDRVYTWGERVFVWVLAVGPQAGTIFATIAAAWYVVVRFFDGLPIWAAIFIGILLATATMRFLYWWKMRGLLKGQRKVDVPSVAKQCVTFFEDYTNFIVPRSTHEPREVIEPPDSKASKREWEKMVARSQNLEMEKMQRFGPRFFAIIQQLRAIGISIHHPHFSDSNVIFIGAVGELLLNGHLEEARKLDPNMTWSAHIG